MGVATRLEAHFKGPPMTQSDAEGNDADRDCPLQEIQTGATRLTSSSMPWSLLERPQRPSRDALTHEGVRNGGFYLEMK
jgi:hypothetical protein